MRLERMLAIINILTERGKVTAPELSEIFEVSRRTIVRDIDALTVAGVPIVTTQGKNGGISLMEGYTLDKRILKREELGDIIAGLKGVGSVSGEEGASQNLLINRISNDECLLHIDLASFYRSSLTDKIECLKIAIKASQAVTFEYYSPKGKRKRLVHPYRILYKWSDWYLQAFCVESGAFRFFKLRRLWQLSFTSVHFSPVPLSEDHADIGEHLTDENTIEVLFDKSVTYLIVETYGPNSFVEENGPWIRFKCGYTDEAFILRWIMGFGNLAKIVSPPALALKVKEQSKKVHELYEHDI